MKENSSTFVGETQDLAMGSVSGILSRKVGGKAAKSSDDLLAKANKASDDLPPDGEDLNMSPAGEQPTHAETPAADIQPRDTTLPPEDMVDRISEGKVNPEHMEGRIDDKGQRNINLDHYNNDTTKQVMEIFNREEGGYLANPDRKVQTHEETISRAQSADTLKNITGSKPPESWNSEDLVSAHLLLDDMAREIKVIADKITKQETEGVEVGTEGYAEFEFLSARFNALQYTVSGRVAEAGRILNSLQAVSKATEGGAYYKQMSDFMDASGGKLSSAERAKAVSESHSLAQTAASLRMGWGERATKTLSRWRYNMMLSSVRTHVANVTGSLMSGVYEKGIVKPITYSVNQSEFWIRNGLAHITGKEDLNMAPDQRMAFAELYSVRGYIDGVKAGFIEGGKALKGEPTSRNKVAVESGYGVANKADPGASKPSAAMKVAGEVGSTPTRMLAAEDEMMYAISYNGRLRELAIRRATAEGKNLKQINQKIDAYLQSPPEDMVKQAEVFGAKLTYTNDPNIYGKLLGTIANTAASWKNNSKAFELFVPFVRTPANLLGYAIEASGGQALLKPTDTVKMLAGNDPVMRAEATARVVAAAGLYKLTESLFSDGTITGTNPGNYNLVRAREAGGWRAGSIKIGKEYYQMNRADPLGLVLEGFATYHDLINNEYYDPENPKHVSAGLGVIMELADMMADRSFLSGIGDLFKAIGNASPKQLGNVVSRAASSYMTPGIVRDMREFNDPYRRSMDTPKNFEDTALNRIRLSVMNAMPQWSEDLPTAIDANGNDITNVGSGLWRSLVPVRVGQLDADPVVQAYISNNVPISKPDYKIKLRGMPPVDLLALDGGDGWVYRKYQIMVGKRRHQFVEKLVNAEEYKQLVASGATGDDSIAQDMIRDVMRKGTQLAKLDMLTWIDGKTEFMPQIDGESARGEKVQMQHALSMDQYKGLAIALKQRAFGIDYDEAVIEKARKTGLYELHDRTDIKGLAPELKEGGTNAPRF